MYYCSSAHMFLCILYIIIFSNLVIMFVTVCEINNYNNN